jgi:hypothetical protein
MVNFISEPMTHIITPSMTVEEIQMHARQARMHLKYDFNKLCGTLTLSEDPISIQKRLRDEWQ